MAGIPAILLVVVACAAPWALGAADPRWWSLAAFSSLGVTAAALLARAIRGGSAEEMPRRVTHLTLALPLVALLGLVPIPMALRAVISPSAANLLVDSGAETADGGWRTISLDPHSTIGAAVVAAAFAAVFWFTARAARDERHARVLTGVLMAAGTGLAVYGLVQRLCEYDERRIFWRVELPDVATPFGPYVNRNHFAGAMLLFAGVAAGSALAAASARRFAASIVPAAAGVCAVVALAATTSRGALVGLVAGAVFLSAAARHRRPLRTLVWCTAALVVVAGALAALGLLGDLVERVHVVLVGRESNRFAVQWDALRVFAASPVFGTGAGTFAVAYQPFQTIDDIRYFSNAHSDWAQFLMETGLVGAAFAALALREASSRVRPAWLESGAGRWLTLGPAAGCVAMCVHGFFEPNLHLPSNALLFAVTLSLACAASMRHGDRAA